MVPVSRIGKRHHSLHSSRQTRCSGLNLCHAEDVEEPLWVKVNGSSLLPSSLLSASPVQGQPPGMSGLSAALQLPFSAWGCVPGSALIQISHKVVNFAHF